MTELASVAAALPTLTRKIDSARALLAEHIADGSGYVAWSGGKDSTAAMLLVRAVDSSIPVVWFDSGLEYPETRTYLHEWAQQLQLNFHVIPAVPDALTALRNTGAWEHGAIPVGPSVDLHRILVTEPSQRAHDMFGAGEVTGLRAEESAGRRITLARSAGRYTRKDGVRVCCPVWNWHDMEVRGLLARENVPLNPVYDKLAALGVPAHAQRVGLLVDANGAEHGRFTWLHAGWPDLWEQMCEQLPRLREWR